MAAVVACGQSTAPPASRATFALDPAHGGEDAGARISEAISEKSVTLSFALRLRSLLNARGFNVVLTRSSDHDSNDAGETLSTDDRAGAMNHARPIACISIHATASGRGVHLYRTELPPAVADTTTTHTPTSWQTAQAGWATQSRALQRALGTALQHAEVPVVIAAASVRPLDSLTCPAVVVELAPNDAHAESVADGEYQQRIATAVAAALIFWPTQSPAAAPDTRGGAR